MSQRSAIDEFNTSYIYERPEGFPPEKAFKIKNDYPRSSHRAPPEDKPWLRVDFKTNPEKYCALLKDYFFRGNTENGFNVHKNEVRSWYHPPWLHPESRGREPINGLTFGSFLPPGHLAREQKRWVQSWACSYFNWDAATVLGDMWHDPNEPKWDKHLQFPVGSVICENIFCDIKEDEVPNALGAPEIHACIGELPPNPDDISQSPIRKDRKGIDTCLRLVQVDFATRDDRSPIGWVFGTYVCDGKIHTNRWDSVFSIGLQWGNDPDLLQKQYDEGKRPTQLWTNPIAIDLIKSLGADRPWLGWHDRLGGLADDFIGTCTSCHATAQRTVPGQDRVSLIQVPRPKKEDNYVQKCEEAERLWLRNIPSGTPFGDSLSGDYSLAVESSFRNYMTWKAEKKPTWLSRMSY